PLFAACYEWTVAQTLRSKTIKPDLLPRSVHTSHHLVIHRPPEAGDRLLTRGQVLTVRPSRNGTFVVIRYSTVDRNGRPVTTTDYGSVFRGVTTDGKANAAAVVPLERLEPPGGDELQRNGDAGGSPATRRAPASPFRGGSGRAGRPDPPRNG